MPRFRLLSLFIVVCGALALTNLAEAGSRDKNVTRFVFKDVNGKVESAKVITSYTGKSAFPFSIFRSKHFAHLDPKLIRAATIADERANAHSKSRCWRYVKQALVASGAINSYPKSEYARQAGDELVHSFGWVRLSVRDPYQAPVGSVLVYGSRHSAGHVEIRTPDGFVSDFRAKTPSRRPLIGVYAKVSG
ncbi:MAG TPA: hypothetical protein VGI85_11315 [Chthoniobacterales bacterium]